MHMHGISCVSTNVSVNCLLFHLIFIHLIYKGLTATLLVSHRDIICDHYNIEYQVRRAFIFIIVYFMRSPDLYSTV
jgi:hypothetical protein